MRRSLTALALTALMSSAAFAADLPARTAYKAPLLAPAFSWTGLYVGLNAGYGWADQSATIIGAGVTGAASLNADGFLGGAQIGYNWQFNNIVLGVEADIQGADVRGSGVGSVTAGGVTVPLAFSSRIEYFGTVRGRFGVAFDRWLPYVTGGFAYGGGRTSATAGGITTSVSDDNDGWTVGGGLEHAFAPGWSAKVEYLYLNFGGTTTTVAPGVTGRSSDLEAHVVRAGINYRFNGF